MGEREARTVTRILNLAVKAEAARPGCVQMLDLFKNRVVLTSNGRKVLFADVYCDVSNLITNPGIVSDTTMKVTQVMALNGGAGPQIIKLSNTIVILPNAWGNHVSLDAVEAIHDCSTASEIIAMLGPFFTEVARSLDREHCGVPALVTDQSISLDDGLSKAWRSHDSWPRTRSSCHVPACRVTCNDGIRPTFLDNDPLPSPSLLF